MQWMCAAEWKPSREKKIAAKMRSLMRAVRASGKKGGAMSYTANVVRERGRYGPYGGRYVPETLMAPLEELERVYAEARADHGFQARTCGPAAQFCGASHAAAICLAAHGESGRRANLSEARGFAAHRRAQDQQLPRAGPAGGAHGEKARDRGDGRGAARRGDGDGGGAAGADVHGVHGHGGHGAAAAEREPHAACWARK